MERPPHAWSRAVEPRLQIVLELGDILPPVALPENAVASHLHVLAVLPTANRAPAVEHVPAVVTTRRLSVAVALLMACERALRARRCTPSRRTGADRVWRRRSAWRTRGSMRASTRRSRRRPLPSGSLQAPGAPWAASQSAWIPVVDLKEPPPVTLVADDVVHVRLARRGARAADPPAACIASRPSA
jgi:hypothetical protein